MERDCLAPQLRAKSKSVAHKSFLTSDEWQQAEELLNPPLMTPDGDVQQGFYFTNEAFSAWLGQKLEEKIKSFPHWQETHPVTLGSWARGDLCPKSDIDMLFCGDEKVVIELVDFLQAQGFKLRYRMPQDPTDWTVNVEPFDVLALLKARPWTSFAAQNLYNQQKKIWLHKTKFRKEILKKVKDERKSRAQRYDSITNYLEPHLKFGPGGLRDLEQGLQLYELFAEKFSHSSHALNILQYYRNFFISIRQKMHLLHQNDVMASHVQFDLAKWLGFSTHKSFMRELERGLSRVHFYSDWIVEVADSSQQSLNKTDSITFNTPQDLSKALQKDSSLRMQKKVRESLDNCFAKGSDKTAKSRKLILESLLNVETPDAFLVSAFRSRLIDKLVPEIQRLVGYVQHDQYHRFTADSHIMQACREVKRVYQKSSELSALKVFHHKLTALDWKILSWTALYHDLAKGLGAGELHGDLGTEIVKRDFKEFGFSKPFTDEVLWMVKNHLELSSAAFRKNPRDPQLWQELQEKGIQGVRLYRLALFTAIDIRATNPEAWNDWKSKLLKDLCVSLESKKAQDFFQLQKALKQKNVELSVANLENLSVVLIENLGVKAVAQDLAWLSTQSEESYKIFTQGKDIWVRFFCPDDRPGLLSQYVQSLFSVGLAVRHAAIHTLPDIGVYDWFQLSTQKQASAVKLMLKQAESLVLKPVPQITFDSVELVSSSLEEWVFLFKGLDQPGFLAKASLALTDHNLSISSARVHTWGRKVEDVFVVKALKNKTPQTVLAELNAKLIKS